MAAPGGGVATGRAQVPIPGRAPEGVPSLADRSGWGGKWWTGKTGYASKALPSAREALQRVTSRSSVPPAGPAGVGPFPPAGTFILPGQAVGDEGSYDLPGAENEKREPVVDPVPEGADKEAPAAERPAEGPIGDPMREGEGESVYVAGKKPGSKPAAAGTYPTSEYGISSRARKGMKIERHEILQHAWLKLHGLVKRRMGGRSRYTTVLELPEDVHRKINELQEKAGLHDEAVLKGLSAREVVDKNLAILRQAGVDEATRQAVLEDVTEMLAGLGSKL
jgi:hypothetical protein